MKEIFTLPETTLAFPFEVLPQQALQELELPMLQPYIAAGFPSPADDYLEDHVNLRQLLIRNPTATYLVRVRGNSMEDANIYDEDILVVDRSIKASAGQILIGSVNGEFTVKRLVSKDNKLYLQPANQDFTTLEVTEDMDFKAWGVVIWALHQTAKIK
ncbi:LexA family protein [Pontibacter arcticus]|uniref:Peptidase S24 n=1 Tax=Pontibacter arcticus TaxID=2080288 RepID=A0A364RC77_9BACT|nr:translesion error-prone DNA polymerase V autoproteolytic subunit [Pontibacter arcticus]RAU81948.1 peptidase S24 [Pontibacter arcticus]